MIRKSICFVLLLALIGLLFACDPDTVIKADSGASLEIPTKTTSQTSSSVSTETPTSTSSKDAASIPSAIPTTEESETRPPDVPTKIVQKVTGEIPSNISTNPSVNSSWGGSMCEAGGFIYYVSDDGKGKSPVHIARMNSDGSQCIAVTDGYEDIAGLTADDKNLYFETDSAFYALPLNGGNERQLITLDGKYFYLQATGGKLYWEQCSNPDSEDNEINIMCMNLDGTDAKQLLSIPMSRGYSSIDFLATSNGLYYSTHGDYYKDFTLYHTDLQGQNRVQLNKEKIDRVDNLFYDQNYFYYVACNYDDDQTSLYRIDEEGKTTVIKDFHAVYMEEEIPDYYGISGNVFYYFIEHLDGDSLKYDLHSYDIILGKDKIIANLEMGLNTLHWNESVLQSVRGKTIDVQSSVGFYILGNDLYYSFWTIP